jgi:hypothetical protein
VGRTLWREDGSVFCICCWVFPMQSFSGPSPLVLATIFIVSDLRRPISSPLTTRRVTVEVFDPASTRDTVLVSESESYVTTDGQSASLSWYKAPIRGLPPDFFPYGIRNTSDSYVLDSVGRALWREDGSVFCMCHWPLPAQSISVLVPWDLRPYFTVSDLRLPFSSSPTTRRVTVEVFDPAFKRVSQSTQSWCRSQSQSHIATDGQSVSKSWCRAPFGAYDQIFSTVWQLRSCFLLWGGSVFCQSHCLHYYVICYNVKNVYILHVKIYIRG